MSTVESVLKKNDEKSEKVIVNNEYKNSKTRNKEENNDYNTDVKMDTKGLTGRNRPKNGVKRYSLNLPCDVYDKVKEVADENDTSVMELLKRFIKLGLVAAEVEKDENSELIIRQNGKDKELMIML